MAPVEISAAEASRLGYTLTSSDCRGRLTLRGGDLLALLARGEMLSARVTSGGAAAYRVRPADLDAFIARQCSPAPRAEDELLRLRDAVAILAGGPVHFRSSQYGRLRQRLDAAVERDRVTRYLLMGRVRYSRREVEAERDRLAAHDIGPRPMTQRTHHAALRRRMVPRGLVDTATAAKLVGVPQRTASGWASRGLYGAQKLEGQWWLKRDELPAAPRPYGPPEAVRCAHCGELHDRGAWEVRNAEREGRGLYCQTCWPEAVDATLRAGRRYHKGTDETAGRRADAQRRRWSEADDDERSQKRRELRQGHLAMTRSPKRFVGMVRNIVLARHGRDLTDEERRRAHGGALSRAQRTSGRSATTRLLESRVRELDARGKTAREIHAALYGEFHGITENYVRKLRQRLGLERRKPGPRAKSS